MKYPLASWSGLMGKPNGMDTQDYVAQILASAAKMWGEGTEEKQADGSYILTYGGVKNRVYFEDGQIWRSDEMSSKG